MPTSTTGTPSNFINVWEECKNNFIVRREPFERSFYYLQNEFKFT